MSQYNLKVFQKFSISEFKQWQLIPSKFKIDHIVFSSMLPAMRPLLSAFSSVKMDNPFSAITNIYNKIWEAMDFSSVFESIQTSLNLFAEELKKFDFSSFCYLDETDVKMLKRYYWVIPYEYKYRKVWCLNKHKTRTKFEQYMNKYFNVNRTRRLFRDIKKNLLAKDKKNLITQIERAYFNNDYAICITSLITLLDGLTLQLLDPKSKNQHLSHIAILELIDYMRSCPPSEANYELYLEITILNNFYSILYANENFKTSNRRLLSRHMNSHGVKYSSKKIDVLRLLNSIYFCQYILDKVDMDGHFTSLKGKKGFQIID